MMLCDSLVQKAVQVNIDLRTLKEEKERKRQKTMFLHYNNQFILQSCMSTVGLGGSILFRQLLPFPVYANVCLSSIGLSGGGIVIASQHGFESKRLSQ